MNFFARLRGGVRAYFAQLHALKRNVFDQVTGTMRDTAQGVTRTFQAWRPTLTRVAKRALLVYVALVLFLIVLCCTVLSCAALAAVSAGTLRYMLVVNAPGNQMHTLDVNVMPLFTEPWRLSTIQDEVMHFTVQPPAALHAPHNSSASLSYSSSSSSSHGSSHMATTRAHRVSAATEYLETEAAKMRLGFLSQYAQSIIGTSTLLIPSATPRPVFSKDGAVDVDSLFSHPTPMFNGKGTYAAQLQLVFAKEERGRDASVVVESRMLYAEAPQRPQTLHTLGVLFSKAHSAIVRTGERPKPLLLDLVQRALTLWFYVPVRLYATGHYYLLESKEGMTFPPLLFDREVAVSLDLYSRFAPPTAVQPRLRALNFTVYQLLEPGESRLKLSRIHLFSMVQLSGLPYWLLQYPLLSFALLCCGFFTLYMGASCLFLLFATLFIYVRFFYGERGGSAAAMKHNGVSSRHTALNDSWESSSESGESHPLPKTTAAHGGTKKMR